MPRCALYIIADVASSGGRLIRAAEADCDRLFVTIEVEV